MGLIQHMLYLTMSQSDLGADAFDIRSLTMFSAFDASRIL